MVSSSSDGQNAFRREVASGFGLVPNFFASAPDAPEIIARLWDFAKAGYLDTSPLQGEALRLSLQILRGALLYRAPLRFPRGAGPLFR